MVPNRHIKRESILQKCLDISSGMFIGLDKEGKIILANIKASELLGYPMGELIGKDWFKNFIPSINRNEIRKVFDNLILGKLEIFEFVENEVLTSTGDIKIIKWHNSILHDKEDNIIGLLSSGEDITDQKLTSSALMKKRMQLQKIFDLLPIGLWITDESGNLLKGNPAGMEIWGAYFEQEKDKNKKFKAWRMPEHEEIKPDDRSLMHTLKEGITIENELIEIETAEGNKRLILNYTAPVINEEGKIEGAIVVNQDVTNKMRLEQSLAESEERFRQALNATKDGLFDWNLATNEVYYSSGWKSMLGYKDDEIKNEFSEWERLTEEEDRKKSLAVLKDLFDGKIDRFEIEFKMKHKDGHWVDILSRANTVLDKNGKATRLIGIHVDVTELKQYRERLEDLVLQRTKDLEEKNAELQKYNKLFIGREFRIKELRDEVKELKRKLKEIEPGSDSE